MSTDAWTSYGKMTLLEYLVETFVNGAEVVLAGDRQARTLCYDCLEDLGLIDSDSAVTREKCRQAATIIFDRDREANLEAPRANTVPNMRYYANMLGEDVPPGIFADMPCEEFPLDNLKE